MSRTRSIMTTAVLVLASAGVLAISARNVLTGSSPHSGTGTAAPATVSQPGDGEQAITPPPFTAERDPSPPGLPAERGGQDLIGTRFPDLRFDRWLRTDRGSSELANAGSTTKAKATLYRWWTEACPFCEASMPAIERLRRTYAEHGLRVVGVYHPKPPRPIPDDDILAAAERLGYSGEVAVDEDWSALRRAYLSRADRSATSVTFLVDAEGTTRFVHPGPQFFPSDDPAHAQANDDFHLIERAIMALLDIEPAPAHSGNSR